MIKDEGIWPRLCANTHTFPSVLLRILSNIEAITDKPLSLLDVVASELTFEFGAPAETAQTVIARTVVFIFTFSISVEIDR